MKITVRSSTQDGTAANAYLGGYVIDDHEINNLIGKVLTLVETLGLQEKQEQSFKDIVKQIIRSSIGVHTNAIVTREVINLIYNFNRELGEECIKTNAKVPNEVGGCLRDGDYELTFTSKH